MTTKERLHELVDRLREWDIETAGRILEALAATGDPVAWALEHAREDDEPETEAERGGAAEGRAELEAGQGRPLDLVRRELGL